MVGRDRGTGSGDSTTADKEIWSKNIVLLSVRKCNMTNDTSNKNLNTGTCGKLFSLKNYFDL